MVLGYREKYNGKAINTTSRSNTWSRGLSPFYLTDIELYGGYRSKNMENGWQFTKVYPEHADSNGDPTQEYYNWAIEGWNDGYAHRYPMGKGTKPLYSLWNGRRLGYIEARKEIYIPLYAKAVVETMAFKLLVREYYQNGIVALRDFDGYNHRKLGMSYDAVIHEPRKKMGHAFVLAMLLEGKIEVIGNDVIIH